MNNYRSAWDRHIGLAVSILHSLRTRYLLLFWRILWSPTSCQFVGIYGSPRHFIQTACWYTFPRMIWPNSFVWDWLSSPHIVWEGAHHTPYVNRYWFAWNTQHPTTNDKDERYIMLAVPHELFNYVHSNPVNDGVFNNVRTPCKINIRRYERQRGMIYVTILKSYIS